MTTPGAASRGLPPAEHTAAPGELPTKPDLRDDLSSDPFSLKKELGFWKFPSAPLWVMSPLAQGRRGKSPGASFSFCSGDVRDSSDAEGSDATSELPPATAQGQTNPAKMSSGELPIKENHFQFRKLRFETATEI